MQFFTELTDFSRSKTTLPNSLPHFFDRFKSKIGDPPHFYFRQMGTADNRTRQFRNVIVILLDPAAKGHTIQIPFLYFLFLHYFHFTFFSFFIEAAFSDERGMQDDTPKKNVYVTVQEVEEKKKSTGFVKDLEKRDSLMVD